MSEKQESAVAQLARKIVLKIAENDLESDALAEAYDIAIALARAEGALWHAEMAEEHEVSERDSIEAATIRLKAAQKAVVALGRAQ